MGDDKPRSRNKTLAGVLPGARAAREIDPFETTVPGHEISRSDDSQVPVRPDDEGIYTSAQAQSVRATSHTSGSVTLSGERVAEDLARELISRRMTQRGFAIEPDYPFAYHDMLVTLDGFDPRRRVGYQYLSHAGANVVTDLTPEVEAALHDLGSRGVAHVFVLHDYNAPDPETVLERVDAFLASLPTS